MYVQIAKPVVQNRFMKGLVTSGISVSVANVATMPMGMLELFLQHAFTQCLHACNLSMS